MSQRCESISWSGYQCTRRTGHRGDHGAETYAFGYRTWRDEEASGP